MTGRSTSCVHPRVVEGAEGRSWLCLDCGDLIPVTTPASTSSPKTSPHGAADGNTNKKENKADA